jgi:hypothetical protein
MSALMPSLPGPQVDQLLLALLALTSAALLMLAGRRRPLVLAGAYLTVMCFVPIWTGVSVQVFLQPQIAVGLLVLAVACTRAGHLRTRFTRMDLLVLLFVLACVAPLAIGAATVTSVFLALIQYLGAYLVGRTLPALVGHGRLLVVVTVAFALVAVLALAETLTGINVFHSLPGSAALRSEWGQLQLRGGDLRAEGAFGHSIALGASLALALPLVLVAPLRPWVRAGVAVLILVAVVATFSRIALVTAAAGVVLSVLVSTELPRRLRLMLAGAGTVVTLAAVPLLNRVFVAAGDEAANSAAYRADLLSLVDDIDVLGLSSAFARSSDGDVSYGAFGSIDSALILHGLTYGWVSLVLALAMLAAAGVAVLLRRATAPTIAVAAQIPALATVALITQYATMLWFVAGFAVFAQAARAGSQRSDAVIRTGEQPSDRDLLPVSLTGPPSGGRPPLEGG